MLFGKFKICSEIMVYKTNIHSSKQEKKVHKVLTKKWPDAKITFNLENGKKLMYIESIKSHPDNIIDSIEKIGFTCELLFKYLKPEEDFNAPQKMHDFWDSSFIQHKAMWGFDPTNTAIYAKDFLIHRKVKNVLIPGIGYGRNAKIFIDFGIKVTGIEISKTAINIASENYGNTMLIHHGSVTEMPFDNKIYDSIFCHGLLYLLDPLQRKKMIDDCCNQLKENGWMLFSVLSKKTPTYGKGKRIGIDTFEIANGGKIFFYDERTIQQEFGEKGLIDVVEIHEQVDAVTNKPAFIFYLVICKK